jgi:predicted SAM-dependent methyltransferase
MNKEQTAVEWLVSKLKDFPHIKHSQQFKELVNQAKEMEKQQKMQCWETAHQAGRFEGKGIAEENWQTFEQYYNEEYGKL